MTAVPVLVALSVLLVVALGVCVANSMGYINFQRTYHSLMSAEAPRPAVVPPPLRPLETISSFRPLRPSADDAHLAPLDVIAAPPRRARAAAAGGRHLMPLDTISASYEVLGKEMNAAGSTFPPLGTIATGSDSNAIYASG